MAKASINLEGLKEVEKLNESFQKQANEIDKLATFILLEFPDELGRTGESESAVDVSIRLLKQK